MKKRVLVHNCIGCNEHNAIIMTDKDGRVNIYSKFYSLYDKSEDQPADEDWYMDLRTRDVSHCPYCGERLT